VKRGKIQPLSIVKYGRANYALARTTGHRPPLRETILHQPIEDIMTGQLGDGERFSEVRLAHRFKVSRTPIREAPFQLEKLGFVAHRKHIGGVVKKMTPQGVLEIFEIIAALEGQAVESCGVRGLGTNDWALLDDLQRRTTALAGDRQYTAGVIRGPGWGLILF
jgi:DNA-binding GntR family transcriptional regulator